jgi:hypothetical protein
VSESLLNQPRATADVERDVVAVRGRLDYPRREAAFPYIAALDALDRLARDAAECGRLREQLADRERGFAKLVLLAHERGDEFWQNELQIVGDFTLAEARAALGVEGE